MSSPPSDLPPPSQVLLRSGATAYEFVKSLGPAHHGELVLARRRHDGGFSGYAVIKRPFPTALPRRLLEEGRLTSQLHHPNIVAVHHLKGPEEAPVLIFEHTPGYRLDTLLEASHRARLPVSEAFALYVTSEVADALHHAHNLADEHGRALGVVHRDVCPHNILITEHGAVKLLDFGAAWSLLPGRLITEDGELQGSLAHAAPEHVARLPLDARADVYSLGTVLLHLLTGRHLFEGADRFEAERRRRREHALSTGAATALAQRIIAYNAADLDEACRAVPATLQSLVRRALAPDRVERFATAAELARAAREALRLANHAFGRPEALAELTGLRYAALRVQAGESPEEALEDRLLPDEEPGDLDS